MSHKPIRNLKIKQRQYIECYQQHGRPPSSLSASNRAPTVQLRLVLFKKSIIIIRVWSLEVIIIDENEFINENG